MTVNQPMGRLEALEYREAAFYTGDGRVGAIDVMRVHFRAPDGDYYHHDLSNGNWNLGNEALQFMAKWGHRPTTLDGTRHDAHDDQILVPITLAPPKMDQTYALAQTALEGGQQALQEAEWFDAGETSDDDGDDSHPPGGGSPDPGTGNRGGVEDPSDPEADTGVAVEKADVDADAGIDVEVS